MQSFKETTINADTNAGTVPAGSLQPSAPNPSVGVEAAVKRRKRRTLLNKKKVTFNMAPFDRNEGVQAFLQYLNRVMDIKKNIKGTKDDGWKCYIAARNSLFVKSVAPYLFELTSQEGILLTDNLAVRKLENLYQSYIPRSLRYGPLRLITDMFVEVKEKPVVSRVIPLASSVFASEATVLAHMFCKMAGAKQTAVEFVGRWADLYGLTNFKDRLGRLATQDHVTREELESLMIGINDNHRTQSFPFSFWVEVILEVKLPDNLEAHHFELPFLSTIQNMVAEALEKKDAVLETIKEIAEKICNWIGIKSGVVKNWFSSVLDKFYDAVSGFPSLLGKFKMAALIGLVGWLMMLAITGIKWISEVRLMNGVSSVLNSIGVKLRASAAADLAQANGRSERVEEFLDCNPELESHGPVESPATALASLVAVSIGLGALGTAALVKRMKEVSAIMAGALVCTSLASQLLAYLPVTLHEALTIQSSTPKDRLLATLRRWQSDALAVVRLQYIPKVVSSPEYKERVYALINQFKELPKTSPLDPVYNQTFSSLVKVSSIVSQFAEATHARPMPFTVHLFGAPGVCKTLTATKFIRDITSGSMHDQYHVPPTSEFWDGYRGQKDIIMDEFLVGDQAIKTRQTGLWLTLASTAQFFPPLASIDNITTGIKGTTGATIRTVCTLNNNATQACMGFPAEAINRRYAYKIKITPSDAGLKYFSNNTFDLSSMPVEMRANLSFIQFSLIDKFCEAVVSKPMTYQTLRTLMKMKYEEHVEFCQRLAGEMGADEFANKTAEEILAEAIADVQGVPRPGKMWYEYVTDSLGQLASASIGKYFSHGGKKNKNKLAPEVTIGKNPTRAQIIEELSKSELHPSDVSEFSEPEPVASRRLEPLVVEIEDALVKHDKQTKTNKIRDPDALKERFMIKSRQLEVESDLAAQQASFNELVDIAMALEGACTPQMPVCLPQPIIPDYTEVAAAIDLGQDQQLTRLVSDNVINDHAGVLPSVNASPAQPPSFWSPIHIGMLVCAVCLVVARSFGRQDVPEKAGAHSDYSNPEQNFRSRRPATRRNYGNVVGHSDDIPVCQLSYGPGAIGGIFVDNKHVVTVKHTLRDLPLGAVVHIQYRGASQSVAITSSNRRYIDNTDICCLTLDVPFPGVRKQTHRFMYQNDISNIDAHSVLFIDPYEDQVAVGRYEPLRHSHHKKTTLTLNNVVVAPFHSEPGYCGHPYVINGGLHHGKVWAINAAGSNNGAVGVIITRQQVEEFVADEPVAHGEKPSMSSRPTPPDQKVFLGRTSKCNPSKISPYMYPPTDLQKPLMTADDPRNSSGLDPAKVALSHYASNPNIFDVDQEVVEKAKSTLVERLSKVLSPQVCKTRLSVDDAIRGIPGKLSPINRKTCPGFPLMKAVSQGKTRLIPLDDNGDIIITAAFRQLCQDRYDQLFTTDEPMEHRFVAFIKDEPTKTSKIINGQCRLVFCADVVTNIALRMAVGGLLGEVAATSYKHGIKIGLNQYSWDMQTLYDRGSTIDGNYATEDVKGMDRTLPAGLLENTLEVISRLAGLDPRAHNRLLEYNLGSEIQLDDQIVKLEGCQISGGVLTAFSNSLAMMLADEIIITEMYPGVDSNQIHVADYLGDDSIRKVARKFDYNSVVRASEFAKKFGMTLTSDVKDQPLTTSLKPFEETSFLGATPYKYKGRYTGIPVDKTCQRMVHWTKDDDDSTRTKLETLAYMLSPDPTAFAYIEEVIDTMRDNDLDAYVPELPPREVMADVQVYRNVYSGRGLLEAHGDDPVLPEGPHSSTANTYNFVDATVDGSLAEQWPVEVAGYELAPGSDRPGLTKFQNMKGTNVAEDRFFSDNPKTAVSMNPMNLHYGAESSVYRFSVPWTGAAAQGTIIASYAGPTGVLEGGDVNNLQNMPFSRHVFWRGLQSLTVTVNSMRFANGLLCLFWCPLTPASLLPEVANWRMLPHVLIQPNRNTTSTLTVPFQFYRKFLNLNETNASTGTWALGVLSPLVMDDHCGENTLQVQIASSFPRSTFLIPRPVTNAASTIANHIELPPTVYNHADAYEGLEAHGWSDTMGRMVESVRPWLVQLGGNVGSTLVDKGLGLLGLDNPLLQRVGAIQQQYVGMSKIVGEDDCTDMQLYPGTAAREEMSQYSPRDDSIMNILGRPCLLGTFKWTSCNPSPSLFQINLNSAFDIKPGSPSPLNVAILNDFYFWRANVVFHIVPIRNAFQSGRLQVTVAYQTPSLTGNENSYYKQILDFSEDNYEATVEVPWNAATTFLRTWENVRNLADDPIEDYSLGRINIGDFNPLVVASNVTDSIDVLVYISFKDVIVAEPRPFSQFLMRSYPGATGSPRTIFNSGPAVQNFPPPTKDEEYVSHGFEESEASTAEKENTQDDPEAASVSKTTTTNYWTPLVAEPGQTNLGKKFEFYPRTFSELVRRGVTSVSNFRIITAKPMSKYNLMFRGWSGGIRFQMYSEGPNRYVFCPQKRNDRADSRNIATVVPNGNGAFIGNNPNMDPEGVFISPLPAYGWVENGNYYQSNWTGAAMEKAYQTSSSSSWVKLNCPFKVHLNMCRTLPAKYDNTTVNSRNGYFDRFQQESGVLYSDEPWAQFYCSGADDFRFHVFCPPQYVFRMNYVATGNTDIGGLRPVDPQDVAQ
ncbi:polyprotein [Basavirus sp.]|nr:polyprotein [Basavirus sp.]